MACQLQESGMKFHVQASLNYHASQDATLLLNVHALKGENPRDAARPVTDTKPQPTQQVISENFSFTGVPHGTNTESFLSYPDWNRLVRIGIPGGKTFDCHYHAVVDNAFEYVDCTTLPNLPVSRYSAEQLRFINPSRYCQSDKLYRLAQHQFGEIRHDLEKVMTIVDWINQNVEYVSGSTTGETSAYDTATQQTGVCRDFAHLGIAFCRALEIPARYVSVYAYQLNPPDFHAVFEAFVCGRWLLFDATKLAPLNGLVRIATGSDAGDAAFANLFGMIDGGNITVSSTLADPGVNFEPFYYQPGQLTGISYAEF